MLEYILLIVGLFLLVKSADWLVDGASSLARKMGVSTLIIGLTVVALGTSLPELFVNVIAALKGSSEIAFGNIIGSNLSNTLLVLGVLAVMVTLKVHHTTTLKEVPFSLLAALLLVLFSLKQFLGSSDAGFLTRFDGLVLLLFFCIFLYYIFELAKSHPHQSRPDIKEHTPWAITGLLALGVVGLYIGGRWTVDGAVALARLVGLSEYVISATIIAIGTSLPELVTSVVAAKKKDVDLAVGNIVGSNIFNIFWVLGLTSVITPLTISSVVIADSIILFFITLLLFLFLFLGKKHSLQRAHGVLFLVFYVAYLAFLLIRG